MDIRAAEISNILKKQIKGFGTEAKVSDVGQVLSVGDGICLLYTSPSPRDGLLSRMPSSA